MSFLLSNTPVSVQPQPQAHPRGPQPGVRPRPLPLSPPPQAAIRDPSLPSLPLWGSRWAGRGGVFLLSPQSPAPCLAEKWLLHEQMKTLLPSLFLLSALFMIKGITYLLPNYNISDGTSTLKKDPILDSTACCLLCFTNQNSNPESLFGSGA